MSAATIDVDLQSFTPAYLDKADAIFLRPSPRYTWEEVISGAEVRSQSGGTRRMFAVDQNTTRAFHRVEKACPGAKTEFIKYFMEERTTLIPLLYVPLDSWILKHPGQFTDQELSTRQLSRTSTYKHVASEQTHVELQWLLAEKSGAVATERARPFHPIYFDLIWNDRYRKWGGNLFETNPVRSSRLSRGAPTEDEVIYSQMRTE